MRRSLGKNVALALVAVLASLAVVELLLRLALPTPPHWRNPQESYVFDEEMGHRLRPSQSCYTSDKPVAINSKGIRDTEYAEFPAAGVHRILAIGDSQTFGNGLVLPSTWPKQLEKRLNVSVGDGRWEVLNAGIPGTDTWQHEIFLRRLLLSYHPSLAIVAVYVNDVSRAYPPQPANVVSTNSLTKRLGHLAKESTLFMVALQGSRGVRAALSPSAELLRERAIVTGGSAPLVEEGWAQLEHSLATMKGDCDRQGTRLVVLIIPRRDEVAGIEKTHAFDDRVRAIAERNTIPCVAPLAALEAEFRNSGNSMFVPWDGHNAELANAVIAGQLANAIEALTAQR